MAKKPSRDMLTAGVVGSYLLASAWGILFVSALILLFVGSDDIGFQLGVNLAGIAIISGVLWVGGAVCEGIGWVGLGRLHVGLPRIIGWLEGSLPVASLVGVAIVSTAFRNAEAVVHGLIILQLLHYVLALAWLLPRRPRGRALPAVIGYALALIGGGTLYALALARVEPQVVMTTLVFIGLGGATIAHLSTGLFFASQRLLADSVNTF